MLNATYSSLSSASPSASSYTFDPSKLLSQTTSSSIAPVSTSASASDSTSNGQTTVTVVATTAPERSNSLSGGAIGGIVVGAVIAVIVALGAIYFLLRRNRSQQTPGAAAGPRESVYTMPPADSTLAADGKLAISATAPTMYSEPAYGVGLNAVTPGTSQWGPTYPTALMPMDQVHEADATESNLHELPGR